MTDQWKISSPDGDNRRRPAIMRRGIHAGRNNPARRVCKINEKKHTFLLKSDWPLVRIKKIMASKLNIEEQFRQAILTASMSRYELAKRSGVSQGVLSNFVNRRRSLTLETAAKLAEVLELDIISRKDCGRKAR